MSDEERRQRNRWKLDHFYVPCAVCGFQTFWPDVHHVVSKQELKKRGREDLLWDTKNAMPLCPIGSPYGNGCHEKHENASSRIPFSALSADHLAFAEEVLGEAADHYLRRRYADDG